MRTTVTLDPDVAEGLKALARQRNLSFKEVLNGTLRVALGAGRRSTKPYKLPSKAMGVPKIDLTHALRVADELEDEENIRKLELRK